MAHSFITSVYGQGTAEYTIKKSRFIATLQEIHDESEAAACLERIRKQYWDARHNCYAYQLGPGGSIQKSSDDGEPAGTAGRPILEILKKQGITNTIAIVTRYFGGVKLGASGLIRAYGHAVVLALEEAQIADYIPHDVVTVCVPYSFVSTVERLTSEQGLTVADRSFADTVTFTLHIPQEQTEAVKHSLINATNGRAQITDTDELCIPIIRKRP